MRRRLLWFACIVILAAVASAIPFLAITVPFDRFPGPRAIQWCFVALDLPVSLLNRVYPDAWRTHLAVFVQCSHTYCFPDAPSVEAARYLRAGVPAYAILFSGFAWIARRIRARVSARGSHS